MNHTQIVKELYFLRKLYLKKKKKAVISCVIFTVATLIYIFSLNRQDIPWEHNRSSTKGNFIQLSYFLKFKNLCLFESNKSSLSSSFKCLYIRDSIKYLISSVSGTFVQGRMARTRLLSSTGWKPLKIVILKSQGDGSCPYP